MQSHGDHGQGITQALAGIAENISDTAVPLEASIAVFNADPSFGECGIGLFLLLGQFVFGFTFLFAFAFERNDNLCIPNRESLEATVSTYPNCCCTRDLFFIHDLLIMLSPRCLLTHGQNPLRFGVGNGDVFARMSLLLARIVLLLLFIIFGAAHGSFRSIGQYSQFLQLGKLRNDGFQGPSSGPLGPNMDLFHGRI